MLSPELSTINVYPIKSSRGIALSNAWVDNWGLAFDRRFVLSDGNGQFISGRTQPNLCLVSASLAPDGLLITAPDMPVLKIKYQQFTQQYKQVTIWKDTITGQYCSPEYDEWFSKYLGIKCQLVFFGEQSSRRVKNRMNQLAFADGYPLLLISQASLNDLNSRMTNHQVSMSQFRPNIVIDHTQAFEEDTWKHIRIGEVEFEVVKPCARCIFTTVDPSNAEKHHKLEPLATLKQFRQVENGDVMFGQNLIALNQGQICQGDSVTVISKQSPPAFHHVKNASPKKKASHSRTSLEVTTPTFPIECVKIADETHDVKTFWFKTENNQPVNYIAGQHLPFSLTIDGKKINRCYTLSSSPTRPNLLSITVKRVNDYEQPGLVSNYLHDNFKVGDKLLAKQPSGNFHIEAIKPEKLLMLSAGSGITPMLSMMRTLVDKAINNDVVFFHSAHCEKDLIAIDEIKALARQHENCRLDFTLTKSAPPEWTDYQGRLTEQMLSNIPSLLDREVLVCGPEAFREHAKTLLLSLGLAEKRFHFESFGKRKKPETSKKQASEIKQVNILFDSWDTFHKGNTHEPLLDQAETAGLAIPYSCRAGMCGTCKVKLESGEVEQLADDGLMIGEKDKGYILACSCIPLSDLVITSA